MFTPLICTASGSREASVDKISAWVLAENDGWNHGVVWELTIQKPTQLLNMAIEIVDLPINSMVIIQLIIDILVGGDWDHGILNDFPETVGNSSHHPN